ncbi:beta-1,3-glucosyltransferase [Sporolactobacillus inulinus]|uniref:Beta-1,3-glucosyltransferase n=1 Tax=Sporolactobacillus inulinus TaxID=2078 RepID=A0A4Y1ZG46_9BACL|nr:glycosyltransferase family 2 protein [Sporolactobacillus inulinus]GAY77999.1 beta-1,3-glucosyltransferase [Sporolactobacillus inulinus]
MKKVVKISIIIPMHNVEKYIATTLQSIIDQSINNVEVLCIDDHSEDNTQVIVSSLSKRYPFIHLLKNKNNLGVSESRNLGLDRASGKYVMFVDSDDKLESNMLELMYKAAIRQDADLVISNHMLFSGQGAFQNTFYEVFPSLRVEGEKKIINHPELFFLIYVWGKLFKCELLRDVRFPKKISYCEDQCPTVYAYLNANKIYMFPSAIYYYRQRDKDDSSLVRTADRNPHLAMSNIIDVLKINELYFRKFVKNSNIGKILFLHYLNRVILCNVSGVVRTMFVYAKPIEQIKIIKLMNQWIECYEDRVIQNVKGFHTVLIQQMMPFIQQSDIYVMKQYIVLLKNLKMKIEK